MLYGWEVVKDNLIGISDNYLAAAWLDFCEREQKSAKMFRKIINGLCINRSE